MMVTSARTASELEWELRQLIEEGANVTIRKLDGESRRTTVQLRPSKTVELSSGRLALTVLTMKLCTSPVFPMNVNALWTRGSRSRGGAAAGDGVRNKEMRLTARHRQPHTQQPGMPLMKCSMQIKCSSCAWQQAVDDSGKCCSVRVPQNKPVDGGCYRRFYIGLAASTCQNRMVAQLLTKIQKEVC
jgi:hypothetical protein